MFSTTPQTFNCPATQREVVVLVTRQWPSGMGGETVVPPVIVACECLHAPDCAKRGRCKVVRA
jgi:hypothetical protein